MQTRRATVSFKTVGCRLNQAETAMIRASFEEAGFTTVPFGAPCDICVIHGCVVTAKAEEDSSRLVRSIKRRHPGACVVLAGCAAELAARNKAIAPFCHSRARPERGRRANGNPSAIKKLDSRLRPGFAKGSAEASGNDKPFNISEKQKEHTDIDFLAGQADKFNLADILSPGGLSQRRGMRNIALPLAPPPVFSTKRAIVKIQDGCDFRCSYCIVPSVRGASRSRPSAEIVAEIKKQVLRGFLEIVLTGANIGCYADGDCRLAQLLEKVEAIPGLKRFRISSLEPANEEKEIIDFMAASKKICRYLHLPLQSGSDRILKAMGRRYTAAEYCATVEYARSKLGLFGLGTDIIVGFPGETENDFMETENLVGQLPFTNLHVFNYSPRPGTPAALMSGQVPAKDKEMRVKQLIELGRQKRRAFAQSFAGQKTSIVVEKINNGRAEGWTGEYLWARIRSDTLQLKQIAEFTCDRAEDDVLIGKKHCGWLSVFAFPAQCIQQGRPRQE